MSCEKCAIIFESDSKLRSHIREKHQLSVTVNIPDGDKSIPITVSKNTEVNLFYCTCGFSAKWPATFRAHAKQCASFIDTHSLVSTTGDNNQQPTLPAECLSIVEEDQSCSDESLSSSDIDDYETTAPIPLMDTADDSEELRWVPTSCPDVGNDEVGPLALELSSLGLKLIQGPLLICNTCSSIIPMEKLASHLKKHKLQMSKDLHLTLENIRFLRLDSLKSHYSSQSNVYEVVAGLPVCLNAYECLKCKNYLCGSKGTLYNHFRGKHHLSEATGYSSLVGRVQAQTLFRHWRNKVFFKVNFRAQSSESRITVFDDKDLELDSYLNESKVFAIDQNPEDTSEPDARNRSLFLHRFRWPEALEELGSVEEIRLRCYVPPIGISLPFSRLHAAIQLYFFAADKIMKRMDRGLLKLFRSTQDNSAYNDGFRPLEQEDTLKDYARRVTAYPVFEHHRDNKAVQGKVDDVESTYQLFVAEGETPELQQKVFNKLHRHTLTCSTTGDNNQQPTLPAECLSIVEEDQSCSDESLSSSDIDDYETTAPIPLMDTADDSEELRWVPTSCPDVGNDEVGPLALELSSLGLKLIQGPLLICNTCSSIIPMEKLASHLKKHKLQMSKDLHLTLENIRFLRLDSLKSHYSSQSNVYEVVAGLPGTLYNHFRGKHHLSEATGYSSLVGRVQAQTLFAIGAIKYFQGKLSCAVVRVSYYCFDDKDLELDSYLNESKVFAIDQNPEDTSEPDARNRSLFLHRFRWPEALEELGSVEEFLYFFAADKIMKRMDRGLLKLFRSTQDNSAYNDGFRPLEQEDTLKDYARRGKVDDVESTYQLFVAEGETPELQQKVFNKVHELLKSLFMVQFPTSIDINKQVSINSLRHIYCLLMGLIPQLTLWHQFWRDSFSRRLVALVEFHLMQTDFPDQVDNIEDFYDQDSEVYKRIFRFVKLDRRTVFDYLADVLGVCRKQSLVDPKASFGTLTAAVNGWQMIRIDDLRSLYNNLSERAVKVLKELTVDIDLDDLVPEDMLDNLTDRLLSTAKGYSFLQNPSCVQLRHTVFRTIVQSSSQRGWFLLGNEDDIKGKLLEQKKQNIPFDQAVKSLPWDHNQLAKYCASCTQFTEYLMVLIHIGAGQPARGNEFAKWKFRNTAEDKRELFIHMGRLMFIKHYGKQRNMTNKEDFSPRFLPRQLSLLLLRYLVLIRPAEQLFCELLYNDDSKLEDLKTSVFLKNGSTLPINGVSEVVSKYFQEVLGLSMGLRIYRDVATYFKERFLEGPQQAQLSTYDAQAGHTRQVAVSIYGRSDAVMSSMDTDVLPNAYTASINWQSLLGLEDHQEATKRTTTEPQAPSVVEHSLPLAQRNSSITEPTVTEVLKPIITRGPRRMTLPSSSNLDDCLELDNPKWDSLDRRLSLLYVTATGSGKSLTFLLPSYIEKMNLCSLMTVVIVPLIALKSDMLRRATAAGLRVKTNWEAAKADCSTVSNFPNLLILTLDQAVNPNCLKWFSSLALEGKLARIVIDEAHTVVVDSVWRSRVREMYRLAEVRAPFVLLTATLPFSYEDELLETFAVNPTKIRTDTVRKNIEYSLLTHVNDHFERILKVNWSLYNFDQNGSFRIVVFCRYKDEVKELQETINRGGIINTNAISYTGDLTDEERLESLAKFADDASNCKVMVATKAFGMGMDYPSIRLVLDVGCPETLLDYVQETGRAGRDGLESKAILLYKERDLTSAYVNDDMKTLLQSKYTCIRQFISEYMDGKSLSCPLLQGALTCLSCSKRIYKKNYKKRHNPMSQVLTMVAKRSKVATSAQNALIVKQHAERAATITERLSWSNKVIVDIKHFFSVNKTSCPVCLVHCFKQRGIQHHEAFRCRYTNGCCMKCMKPGHRRNQCPLDMNFVKHKLCYRCGLPMALDNDDQNYHIITGAAGRTCDNWACDQLLPLAWSAWNHPDYKERIQQHFLHRETTITDSDQQFANFLMQQRTTMPPLIEVCYYILYNCLGLLK
ncbi:hypothetical protein SJAG_05105 [Schizosaccharomyces japonicus yFS275]|uniref:DNA 3'-5' helicase n=1 Tax=Schizosaccharomyces japonicus (strain yFS275 / FY16936) TaxID=402676 RepID=B6K8G3_SCHJY|nr:hypothetical protein SJAG_05105 [Schizosaccharomyces japonicus yFS275]EEB05000.2 hypothetical protein SJAG_05105 [Schizosaccharomyces japonicus yFS275]